MSKLGILRSSNNAGFTAMELLVSLGIGVAVIAAVVATFTLQFRQNRAEEQVAQMQQNARAALDLMVREIQMAKYDPLGTAFTSTYGVIYNASQLQVQADVNGDGTIDTATSGSVENVIYTHDTVNRSITRQLGTNGTPQILADNITAFTFGYYDGAGNAVTSVTDSGKIRKVTLSITARTATPDPNYPTNGGYRTYQISGDISPPNIPLFRGSVVGGGSGGSGSDGSSSGGSSDKDKNDDKDDKDKSSDTDKDDDKDKDDKDKH